MPTGTVKNFNAAKGYGFVLSDDGGKDLIAFGPDFAASGVKGIADGKKISFDVAKVGGKLVATKIKLK